VLFYGYPPHRTQVAIQFVTKREPSGGAGIFFSAEENAVIIVPSMQSMRKLMFIVAPPHSRCTMLLDYFCPSDVTLWYCVQMAANTI